MTDVAGNVGRHDAGVCNRTTANFKRPTSIYERFRTHQTGVWGLAVDNGGTTSSLSSTDDKLDDTDNENTPKVKKERRLISIEN
ncbi:hypothetical protein NQ318_016717 [Aromia moschata]|uniref:Uncharacterized protein n=1 Tax=Aromia moschata TaxID=1265417 RepID=A0AAV8X3T8_9CUCU|nr:hypothetical protein NQ318_016717 [Aromia moschata]